MARLNLLVVGGIVGAVVLFALLQGAHGDKNVMTLDIGSQGAWTVHNENKTIKAKGTSHSRWRMLTDIRSPPVLATATVPGQIHTDLMAAGIIDEPYYR